MNHEIIKRVILDMQDLIKYTDITDREYEFEEKADYILVGVRRSGKSTLLYKKVKDLIAEGCGWDQIIYVNFEDDRLTEFTRNDFDDIIESAHELCDREVYYFFDEIQNISGWEIFARRLADHKARVYITGSNAKMLSSEMEAKLGGRYMSMMIMPFCFEEVLEYKHIQHDENALLTTVTEGKIRAAAEEYMNSGGLPEALEFKVKRNYIQNVYDKVVLGDIIARNHVMKPHALRLLIKKIAETVMHETSFTRLAGSVRATGVKFSADAAITYTAYAEEAYLIFHTNNYVAKFSEKESTPRYYFVDNGFLNLFLVNKKSALLENAVAVFLHRYFTENVFYYRSSVTRSDIDFFLPEYRTAIQVSYSLNTDSFEREISSLVNFAAKTDLADNYIIVTFEEEKTIEERGIKIEVLPLYKFLLHGNNKIHSFFHG